jgi:hypothetical protein
MKLQEGIIMNQTKNLNNGLLWYSSLKDDTEDERNAKIIAKRHDSKINELLGTKEKS